jgi:hypothetical protein
MPGMVSLTKRVAERVARLTDAELVEMLRDHRSEYEPWALELGRAELSRRRLTPLTVVLLRARNAAKAPPPPPVTSSSHAFPLGVVFVLVLFRLASLVSCS